MLGSLLGPALEVSSRAREVRDSSVLSLSPWRAELCIALAPSSSTAACTSSCSGWVKLVVPFSVLRGQAVVRPLLPKRAGQVKCFELLLPLRCPPDVYQEAAAEQQSTAAVWPISSARANNQQCWARGLDWTQPNPRDCTGWSSAQGAASVIKLELWQHGDSSQGACQLLWWMAQCGLVASPSGVPRSLPGCTAGAPSYIDLEWMQRPELPTWSCRPVNSTQDLPSQLEAHIAIRLPFRVAYALLSLTSSWLLPWELVSQPLLDMLAHADPLHAGQWHLRQSRHACMAHSAWARRLLLPPELELSNRVLREYGQHRDRFMRVNFGNEVGEQLMLISTRNNDPSQLGDPWAQELLKR
ncbi:RNA dependent RNA polymerase [Haematococcus lacustris]|uniref:RNA-dependent RNA polymerase n=1 Tax=Haematococcus lacustris TaxID=44745 RepID=A0A699Z833_HAELA|nr:RNA dependent RNA polymerase [Haematococcus lacustris]